MGFNSGFKGLKTLSQFTFKNTHVKNVCDAYLKLD